MNEVAELQQIALGYLRAGLAPLPLMLDGSKAPMLPHVKPWHTKCPMPEVVAEWFHRPAGIGIFTGPTSHGLETLDFDQWEVFAPWRSMIRRELFGKLVVIETAGGGYHVLYRCREVSGNTKIACWEPADSISHRDAETRRGCGGKPIKHTRIETRGTGGYIVAPGSPLEVHQSRHPYVQVLGPPLPAVSTITPDERKELWQAAATFDCRASRARKVEQEIKRLRKERWQHRQADRPDQDGVPPWDDFDRRGDWSDILEPHGWTTADGSHWTRPGKRHGTSATIGPNDDGVLILTVFSSNAGVLAEGVVTGGTASWGPFRAYAALNHGGDSSAAAKELYAAGYGSRWRAAA